MLRYLFPLFIILSSLVRAHNDSALSSLRKNLSKAYTEKNRAKGMLGLANYFMEKRTDSAFFYVAGAKKIAVAIKHDSLQTEALIVEGWLNLIIGRFDGALSEFFSALRINERAGNKFVLAEIYNRISVVYQQQGESDKANDYAFRSLRLYDELNDEGGYSAALGNIALNYWNKREFSKALEYFFAAMRSFERTKNMESISACYINIGLVYEDMRRLKEALDYYRKGLKIAEDIGHQEWIANGCVYAGSVLIEQKKYEEASNYIQKAMKISVAARYTDGIRQSENASYRIDSARGNFQGALKHFRNYIAAEDSMNSNQQVQRQTRLEMIFEFDKKRTADSIRIEKERKIAGAEISAERNKTYSLFGGLALVVTFSGFIYNRFRLTRKQKKIIEDQKHMAESQKKFVEQKTREITDSIKYASRIQRSMMPAMKYLEKHLRN